jgi:hypothetical protein
LGARPAGNSPLLWCLAILRMSADKKAAKAAAEMIDAARAMAEARASKLTDARRKEIAEMGATARWKGRQSVLFVNFDCIDRCQRPRWPSDHPICAMECRAVPALVVAKPKAAAAAKATSRSTSNQPVSR